MFGMNTATALEKDEGLFDDDDQIKIPSSIQDGKADAVLFAKYPVNDLKMMLAVRTDLGMTKGKLCAQCGHGTLGAFY